MVDIVVVPIAGGADGAIRTLRIIARKIKNTRAPNRLISIWLLRWVNDNFKTQGGKVGGWKPFKLGGRRLPGGGIDTSAKLLQDTGRLRASFSPFYNRSVAGIGTSLPYSIIHELGFPLKNVPARRMLPIASDKAVVNAVVRIYNKHVKKALR